jgi:hypothetical protein
MILLFAQKAGHQIVSVPLSPEPQVAPSRETLGLMETQYLLRNVTLLGQGRDQRLHSFLKSADEWSLFKTIFQI